MEPIFDKLARQMPRRGKVVRFILGVVKFTFLMIVTTVICTIAWEGLLAGKVYSCTDGPTGYLTPGDWVHAHDGLPVAVVPKIIPPHDMSEPDTIKQGWSVAGLWCIWISFFIVSLVVSLVLARLPWLSWVTTLDSLAERRHGHDRAASYEG
jgi:hypothetical protein